MIVGKKSKSPRFAVGSRCVFVSGNMDSPASVDYGEIESVGDTITVLVNGKSYEFRHDGKAHAMLRVVTVDEWRDIRKRNKYLSVLGTHGLSSWNTRRVSKIPTGKLKLMAAILDD